MSALACFRMPNPVTITGRSSSITNSFANAIVPVIFPTEAEVAEALDLLGLDAEDLRCAYCGDRATEWDHLRPLIVNQRPTGYISEIANLVPACGKCNQSKGNKPWREWMTSDAILSPKSKRITDLDERIRRLEEYEAWCDVRPIDFAAIVGEETWETYWQQWRSILGALQDGQRIAEDVKRLIAERYQQGLDE
ncbi:MAG: HNH endonuclease [Chloroflexi bacterium]|nr:HNH endonuclease [Chloroflexota bacterium]